MARCMYCGMVMEEGNSICPRCGKENRPMIGMENLKFQPVDRAVLEQVKKNKPGLFKKKGWEHLVSQLEASKVCFTKVILEKVYSETVTHFSSDDDDSSEEVDYVQLSDLDHNPLNKDVRIPGNAFFSGMEGKQIELVACPSKNGKYAYYLVLSESSSEDMAKELLAHQNDFLNGTDNLCPRAVATAADDVLNKAFDKTKNLFGKFIKK